MVSNVVYFYSCFEIMSNIDLITASHYPGVRDGHHCFHQYHTSF